MSDSWTWLAVKTRPQQEEKASFNLLRQGFSVYLPKCARTIRHARRTLQTARPLFPGYLFVHLDKSRDEIAPIRSTYGVHSLVTMGDKAVEVPEGAIDEIRCRENESGLVRIALADTFSPGDKVSILDGPFLGHTGIFECVDSKDRVTLLVEFFGRIVRTRAAGAAIS